MGSVNGFVLSNTTVDANIKKEKLNTTEIGLNLGFLKSRLSLDASYFMTKTYGSYYQVQLLQLHQLQQHSLQT